MANINTLLQRRLEETKVTKSKDLVVYAEGIADLINKYPRVIMNNVFLFDDQIYPLPPSSSFFPQAAIDIAHLSCMRSRPLRNKFRINPFLLRSG